MPDERKEDAILKILEQAQNFPEDSAAAFLTKVFAMMALFGESGQEPAARQTISQGAQKPASIFSFRLPIFNR